MKGIEADLHADGVVKVLESVLGLHEFEIPKDDGAAVLHLLLDLHGVVLEILQLLLGRFQTQILGGNLRTKLQGFLGTAFLLQLLNVGDLVAPNSQRRHGGWSESGSRKGHCGSALCGRNKGMAAAKDSRHDDQSDSCHSFSIDLFFTVVAVAQGDYLESTRFVPDGSKIEKKIVSTNQMVALKTR